MRYPCREARTGSLLATQLFAFEGTLLGRLQQSLSTHGHLDSICKLEARSAPAGRFPSRVSDAPGQRAQIRLAVFGKPTRACAGVDSDRRSEWRFGWRRCGISAT